MSRSKKTKFTPSSSSSQVDFRAFLKNPALEEDFIRLSSLEILPGRFVKYEDFYDYDIVSYLQNSGLIHMFSTDSRQGYYPFLINLFYTNLTFEDNEDDVHIYSLVKGINIKLSPKSIGRILSIPYNGLLLNDIEMDNAEVLSSIFLPGQGLTMTNNKLKPIPRLIGRILAYNICPKTGSYNYYSRELATCVYAIMAGLDVNWAKIIFDTIVKDHTSFLPYGAFLSHVFRKFHIDLDSETSVIKVFEPFDRAVLHRMKLHDFPHPPPQPPSPPHSSTPAPSSSTQPPFTEPPSSQPPPSYADAFYNSLSVEIESLHAKQQFIQDSQNALLENQSLLMTHFEHMQLKMDSFASTQTEILNILKAHFPPPPPPGSDI